MEIAALIKIANVWWKLGAGIVLGALLCFPLATCHGERIADARNKVALQKANDAAALAEAKARLNADQLDRAAQDARTQTIKDLQNEADKAPDGHKLDSVLDRLRTADKGRKAKAAN